MRCCRLCDRRYLPATLKIPAARGGEGPPRPPNAAAPPAAYRVPLPLWFIPALFDPFHGYAPRSIGGAFLRQKQKGVIKAVFSLLQVKG